MDAASFALIAHDLKNALGSLEGELEAMIDNPTPALANSAYMRCTELRRQFIQFLTVYGADAGMHAHCEDEAPQAVLERLYRAGQIHKLNEPDAPSVTLADVSGAPPYWYFDQRLVNMAMDAAVHNARRFARKQVTLGLRQESGFLIFVIDDDGPGLGAQDPSTASTGLGTSLCKAVAEAHRSGERQGHIELHNRPEGGARFELWLP